MMGSTYTITRPYTPQQSCDIKAHEDLNEAYSFSGGFPGILNPKFSQIIPIKSNGKSMSWRIHLTNQAINRLHILPGKRPVLVAWTRHDRVHFYDLADGTPLADQMLPAPPSDDDRQSEAWQSYVDSLRGPDDGAYLPLVENSGTRIYASDDGKLRLYVVDDHTLYLATEGREVQLDLNGADRVVAVDLDRALGMVVALDEAGRLHIFQQDMRLGAFDLDLRPDPMQRLTVTVSRGGGSIYVSDGRQIVLTDSSGRALRRQPTHYSIARLACSPTGGMVATSDVESGVIRVYHGEALAVTHQKFAIDLIASASQLQLLADLPPMDTVASALAVHSKGILAFAMSGVICTTDISEMDELPRPRRLL